MANDVHFYLSSVCVHTWWVTLDTSMRPAAGSLLPFTISSYCMLMLSISRECNYPNDLFNAESASPRVFVFEMCIQGSDDCMGSQITHATMERVACCYKDPTLRSYDSIYSSLQKDKFINICSCDLCKRNIGNLRRIDVNITNNRHVGKRRRPVFVGKTSRVCQQTRAERERAHSLH